MKTHNFTLVNLDTDSISFSKEDGSLFSEEEQIQLLEELNSNFPDKIKWEHDGLYDKIVVLKAKNYILYQDGKIKKKGSSLKSSKTEKSLKEFMSEVIDCLVFEKKDNIINVYNKYIRIVNNLTDISGWCSKKTVTEAVLNPERTNEQKVFDALQGKQVQMGDKYYMYFAQDESLKLQEHWSGDHDVNVLMKKLFNTLKIFQNVIDIKQYSNYTLKNKKIQELLKEVLNVI